MIDLIVGTDGKQIQLFCIRLLFHCLQSFAPQFRAVCRINILCPEFGDSSSLRGLASEFNSRVLIEPCAPNGDPYYPKLILAHCLEKDELHDFVMYLDYDHLCISEPLLPVVNTDIIYVSSEVRAARQELFVLQSEYETFSAASLHYNTSLIYGQRETISRAASRWEPIYNNLRYAVTSRYVEELSFAISSMAAGARLQPSPEQLQSGWDSRDIFGASLIHYGGEYACTTTVKAKLAELMYMETIPTSFSLSEAIRTIVTLVHSCSNQAREFE